MFLLPIGDDNPNLRTPYVHYAILTVNVAVFVLMLGMSRREEADFVFRWGLIPSRFNILALFTSLYVHAGLAHIFGNMLFLWIVGDNVEDRLGHAGYFVFYHVAGAAAALTHVAFAGASDVPLVGASGAISAVMGAYAVFFPNAKIRIWYWFLLVFTNVVYVSAKWAVGLWFLEQVVLRGVANSEHVAYDAHIGGLIFGVVAALALRLVLKPPDTVRRIVVPSAGPVPAAGDPDFAADDETPAAERLSASEAIESALDSGRADEAYRIFTRATGSAASEPLSERALSRLGDVLLNSGSYGPVSRVCDEFLRAHPGSADAPEAAFRLGTIQSRVFEDFLRARDNLLFAHRLHSNADRRAQALDELKRVDAHLRDGLFRRGK